jgi:hypothetical protein
VIIELEAILAVWRIRIAGDKDISTASTLPRAVRIALLMYGPLGGWIMHSFCSELRQ